VTLGDALELLGDLDDARVLAGGQSLVPLLALRLAAPLHLVDVNRIDGLATVTGDGHEVRIGAMTRQATFERNADATRLAPLFAAATPLVGHFQIRNRATTGGSIAHADPAAEYPAVALALDARMELCSARGERLVPAADFFVSTWTTPIEADELLVAIRFAPWGATSGFAVYELARRHGDFAMVGAACGVELDPADRISRVAIAMFGVGNRPIRALASEQALLGSGVDDDFGEAVELVVDGLEPPSDVHASATYRLRVAPIVVRRALDSAIADARRQAS
jgi:carbon-monoxide dehydrogenase medium subunit